EGVQIRGGEPLLTMWAEGSQRLIAAGSGFLDVTDPRNPTMFSSDQYQGQANVVYNDDLKKWIIIASAQRPLTFPIPEFPRGQYHEEYARTAREFDGFLGIRVYDATDPANVKLLSEFNTGASGHGTHHNFYDGG